MKKLAYFPRYWLDLAQIWCRGYFWILNPKSTIKLLYDVILTSNDVKVKCPYIAYRKCILRHYDVTFCPIFLKTSIYFLLMTDYYHTEFGLIWGKESKITGGGGGIRSPQVENVLNRPGEIGLICPFELTSGSFLIGRRGILVIPKNRLVFQSQWDS